MGSDREPYAIFSIDLFCGKTLVLSGHARQRESKVKRFHKAFTFGDEMESKKWKRDDFDLTIEKPICKKRSLISLISQPLLILLPAPLLVPVPLGGVPLRPPPHHPILAPPTLDGVHLPPTPGALLQARISLGVIDHPHDHILATVRFVVFRVILQNGALRFALYRMIRPHHLALCPLVLLPRGNLGLIMRPLLPLPLHLGSLIVVLLIMSLPT
ncbi:hypothetical protein F0562_008626 [Nyssa sinensis]|uniref:Uncharacterized protein n=1 Tax=Nyssa sinensis TaxID=561372 RepID=A0A5J5A7T1_9ASTE|nr:hypothetical protein F0562_008626 [Nyssa sinensis]